MPRMRLAVASFLVILAAAGWGASGASSTNAARVRAVDSVMIPVSDLDRAVQFYSTVLDFEKTAEAEWAGSEIEYLMGTFGVRLRAARMRLGAEAIVLMEFLAPEGRPIPADSRSNDLWFQHIAIIVSDMDAAYARLRRHKVRHASAGPQTLPDWNPNAGGIKAFYFKDPDGHVLEILQFPQGKGDPKWHRPTDRLFLGIDHTAIVVSDTDECLAFFRDMLGLSVAGESENHGVEQERLNNVFGARLRITSLKPPAGPSIELLEYLAPGAGRPYPPDSAANDLWHWQTNLICDDAQGLARAARSRGYRWRSPGLTRAPGGLLGFDRGMLIRGPDGHAFQFAERGQPAESLPARATSSGKE